MILYLCTDAAVLARLASTNPGDPELWSAAVVLKHSDGPVGFDQREGEEILRHLLRSGVAIEVANRPRWESFEDAPLKQVRALGRRVVACSTPGEPLLAELAKVSANDVTKRKNAILVRHGRAAADAIPTFFEQWVTDDGRVRGFDLRWMMSHAIRTSVWAHSCWGHYGVFLGSSQDEAVGAAMRLQDELGIPVVRVAAERELPVW
jgi:hypothetical protein